MSHDLMDGAFGAPGELPEDRLVPVFDADGHADEGTIHTWLDGMFNDAATARVASHVSGCGRCRELAAEARGLIAGTSRVLAALDGPLSAPVADRVPLVVGHPARRRVAARTWGWMGGLAAAAVAVLVVQGRMGETSLAADGVGPAGTALAEQRTPDNASAPAPRVGAEVVAGNVAAEPLAVAAAPRRGTAAVADNVAGAAAGAAADAVAADPVVAASKTVAEAVSAPPAMAEMSRAGGVGIAAGGVARTMGSDITRGMTQGVTRGMTRGTALVMPTRAAVTPQDQDVRPRGGVMSREQYDRIEDNPFLGARSNPLSTFSIDVDRASYSNVRRFIMEGRRPPKDAVRIEELINYFPYDLPEPTGRDPVRITTESMAAPWQPRHHLVRIALQAQRIPTRDLPPNNLVFLVDVSGSMMSANKLPLVKEALRLLVNELRPEDRVALVTYADGSRVVLRSTSGEEKATINEAIDRLEPGGSTAGGAGLSLAYDVAREAFRNGGNNRVILATDGDFNVGVSSDAELERLIESRRSEGTYLTVLGFGTGNYQAAKMEKLARIGNGNFAYIDQLDEARKVLVEELGATLRTVANDVKLQVEFNPAQVRAYRLIGYENRVLRNEDFADDAKDAGDIGTGHQVTALYEVVPAGVTGTVPVREVDTLRYQSVASRDADATPRSAAGNELAFVKLRYKRPGETTSQLLTAVVPAPPSGAGRRNAAASTDFRFAAAVASFGMLLRDSEYRGNSSAAQVLEMARAALGNDAGGYRAAFIRLMERWRSLEATSDERR